MDWKSEPWHNSCGEILEGVQDNSGSKVPGPKALGVLVAGMTSTTKVSGGWRWTIPPEGALSILISQDKAVPFSFVFPNSTVTYFSEVT